VAYLRQAVWPAELMVIYPILVPSAAEVVAAGAVLAAITAGVVIARRRHPYLAVGWCWFLGMLVPVIGLVQVGAQSRADRYTYLPLIGVSIAICWGVHALVVRSRAASRIALVVAGAAIVALAIVARVQLDYWRDGVALWTRATEISLGVDAYGAHMRLGGTLRDQRRIDEALAHYSEAVRLHPERAEAHQELGLTLQNSGRLEEAIAEYQEAVRLTPGVAELENNLGSALAMSNRITEAQPHFASAVRLKPDFDVARMNLAVADIRLNKKDDAIAELQELLRRNPNDARARTLLEQVTRGKQ
jgi:tetratricopeptide (TPR) repeat protein